MLITEFKRMVGGALEHPSIGLDISARIADTRGMESINTNGRDTMTHGFYIQITGDSNGTLPLPTGPISFGPMPLVDARNHAESIRAYGFDVKIAPLATKEDATNFLYALATKFGATEPMSATPDRAPEPDHIYVICPDCAHYVATPSMPARCENCGAANQRLHVRHDEGEASELSHEIIVAAAESGRVR